MFSKTLLIVSVPELLAEIMALHTMIRNFGNDPRSSAPLPSLVGYPKVSCYGEGELGFVGRGIPRGAVPMSSLKSSGVASEPPEDPFSNTIIYVI